MSSIKTCFVEKADDQGEVEKHVTGLAIRLKDPDAEEEVARKIRRTLRNLY